MHAVERLLEKIAYSQFEYQMKLDRFHDEMQDFKDEMGDFKDAQQRDTREMKRQWGELANKMGTVVEDIVAPSIPRILCEHFGVDELAMLAQRVRRRHPDDRSRTREFDLIAVTDDTLFVNETKSTVRPTDVERFADLLPEILSFFPEYVGYTVVPIMSSLSIPLEMVTALTVRGIYAMGMGPDTMELLNGAELG